MLRAGHRAPDIEEADGGVLVTLFGGPPDTELVAHVDELVAVDTSLDGVRSAMAIPALFLATPLRAETLAAMAQCTTTEADQTLASLEAAGAVRRLVRAGRAYALSDLTRDRFRTRLGCTTRRALDQHFDLVCAYLDSRPAIGRGDAATLLDVAPKLRVAHPQRPDPAGLARHRLRRTRVRRPVPARTLSSRGLR